MSKKKSNSDIDKVAKKIENDEVSKKIVKKKVKPNIFIIILFMVVLLSSIGDFISVLVFKKNDLNLSIQFIKSIILIIFGVFFVINSLSNSKKNKASLILSGVIFTIYNIFSISANTNLINVSIFNQVDNFTGKSLTHVVKWAEANDINLTQIYEYSDMIDEYHIIGQDVEAGTNVKDIKNLTVAISDGPSPDKEVVVPNMVTWASDKVLTFIKENHLSNVVVEFVVSDKVKDTVISQSKSGNMKRSDELKLEFSLGEDDDITDTKLINLKGKSKFEAEFYLKQHSIKYEINNAFSKSIKRNYVMKQSIKAGTVIKANSEDKLTLTISRGPEIKVPDLKKMSMTQITNWIIKNKLKLEFTEQYDENIEDNKVISSNYKKGDTVEQGTLISIVISKGQLIMPDVKDLTEFKEWADKYSVNYQEVHEFSDSVAIGEVISYSHKKGDVIKNDDTITITISDGKEIEVPNVVGMSKSDIISKFKQLELNYSFVYKNSNTVSKDKAISQSISSGSKVSSGTTVTVTLSNGKKVTSSSSSNSNSSSSSSNNTTSTCESKTYTIDRGLNNIFKNYTGFTAVKNALTSYFNSNYPNVNISVVGVDGGDATSGSYIGGIGPGTSITSCNGVTYTIKIAL